MSFFSLTCLLDIKYHPAVDLTVVGDGKFVGSVCHYKRRLRIVEVGRHLGRISDGNLVNFV